MYVSPNMPHYFLRHFNANHSVIKVPYLDLYSTPTNGNVGLVKYALSHGQPINSVLDGVLPLHAVSSGGNNLVIKLLIEQGVDVNTLR